MKIIINRCFGGFDLSEEARKLLPNRLKDKCDFEIDRRDPSLIEIIERLGAKANGSCANLVIVDIPDGVEWYIDDYDGLETIHERHRKWPEDGEKNF